MQPKRANRILACICGAPVILLACNRPYPEWFGLSLMDAAHSFLVPAGGPTAGDLVPPTVLSTSPADGATAPTNTAMDITFSEEMGPATVGTNSTDTSCLGTIQLSSNSFVTCVQMAGPPTPNGDNTAFSLVPAAPLAASTTFQIRVAPPAADSAGNQLATTFTTPLGFTTTAGPDVTAPNVIGTTPADGASGVAVTATIRVTFDEGMLDATITTNTGVDATCSGSFQVSADNFLTCVIMSGPPTFISAGVYEVDPLLPLGVLTTHDVRITTGVQDLAGNALAATYTTPTGFTTGL